jgi:metal-sulfur cluster biosynthetic enzyme
MWNETDILETLRACFTAYPPASGANGKPVDIVDIVSLGLVDQISLAPDPDAPGAGIAGVPPRQTLEVTIVPASSDEDANAMLLAQIENCLAGLPEISRRTVRFAASPVWTADRIDPALRRRLLLDPPQFPILNQRLQIR